MRFPKRGHKVLLASVAVVLASGSLAACGGGSGSSDSKTVTIWTSVDQPVLDGFEKQLNPEAKKQGITVSWKKVNDINTLIMTSIQANKSPDIALIPQPGVVDQVVQRNKATSLDSILDMSSLKSSMTPGTLEAGTFDGKLYGLLVSMNVKSLVFYNKKAWANAGYPIPKSLGQLESLTNKIKSDGGTPWCMGIQDPGGASGWPATDWIEDLVMRYGGATQYNDWVTHKVKFDSTLVKKAADEYANLLFPSGNVAGGRTGIANSNWQTVANPMFASNTKPGCWMLKQGNFITGFFPKNVQSHLDSDVGVFGFPPATAGGDDPTLGGGDLATLINSTSSSQAVMKLLAEKDLGDVSAKAGDYISPHKDFDASLYPNNIVKGAAEVAYNSSAFLFDGSDAMPAAVGAGSFWKDMVAWTSGQESLDQALSNIDQSWPTS